ncbi:zf-HC2 domain-containing protein [Actinoplanes flavus]|uniref:Zf-HC2 domain-containing protein n=1 Tax=Actinoplanes flavus TaxID=2820290 RepID=A0ABS3UIU9_9ACTN|nr:zf-HC2 domain-containing protein [Actinoplanes flavus]MBO3738136.1 zf-HC2 domain-containing protein [Actinoplanes flavus]
MTDFHVADADLLAWAENRLTEPAAWSVEAHLDDCAACRFRVPATPALPPAPMDLPPRGRVRRPTRARRIRLLIGAGPQARVAWFSAVAVTVLLTLTVAAQPGDRVPHWLLLLVAPLLPVLGTAASYGPRSDPMAEMVASTAYGGLRIVLWRTLSVLAVSLPVAAAGGVVSALGSPAVWLLPCCALTALTLALATFTGPALAAWVVSGGWFALVTAAHGLPEDTAPLVDPPATPVWLAVLAAAALIITLRRNHTGGNTRRAYR